MFEVRESAVEEPPARVKSAPRDRRAPQFDSGVEEVQPVRAEAAPREADWSKMPPPPVRQRAPEPEPIEEPEAVPGDRASADEVLAFMGLAPKANGDDDYTLPAEVEAVEEVYEVTDAEEAGADYDSYMHGYHRPKRRWIPLAIVAMLILMVGGGIGALLVFKKRHAQQETQLAEEGDKFIASKNFRQAAQQFDDLMKSHSSSKNIGRYKLLRDFSRAMENATNPSDEAGKRLNEFTDYLRIVDSDDPNKSAVTDRQGDIRDALVRIAEDQVRDARKKIEGASKDFEGARSDYKKALQTQVYIKKYSPPNIQPAVPDDLTQKYAQLNEAIEKGEAYKNFLVSLDADLAKDLNPAKVTSLEAKANQLGYGSNQEVLDRISAAKSKLRERIVFVAGEVPPKQEPVGGLVSLLIGANSDAKVDDNKVVFAASRGVLFALSQSRGQILWATRVGIDSAGLPLRIPSAGRTPETVLVPTANGQGLILREAFTGKFVWRQELPFPIRGQPLLIDRRLYVPLTDEDGTVVVIESNDGSIRGRIQVGQRLGPGAAKQDSTGLIFLAADSQNVYVLDTTKEQPLTMVAMLATNHGPGSLRGEPVVVGGVDDAGQPAGITYLVLPVSDGFHAMKLRSFEIPNKLDQTSVAIPGIEVPLPGWSWFPPVCDQEKVAVVTDAGAFALLGVNQKDNQDPALFPLIMDPPKPGNPGRGLVVHAEECDFWYIANGELTYERMGFDRKEGMRLAQGWPAPLKLGTPLHAGQVSADRKTLFVVTQSTSPPAWLATAVDAKTGAIRWQQTLGLAVQGDPIQLGDYIYQIDQGAGLYLVDPKKTSLPKGQEWPLGGHVLLRPRSDVVGEPVLLPAADGKTAYLVYTIGDGKTLHVIPLSAGQRPSQPIVVQLVAPLAGQPVMNGSTLIMALADGALHRWKIGDKDTKRGSDWRAPRYGESARAFLTAYGKDDILVSDGYRGLTVYNWPANAEPQFKQQLSVPDRIISAPVAMPVKDGPPRIAVADAGGRLNLLEGDQLSPTMKWEMRQMRHGNEITAGPFLIADQGEARVVVVVDRNRIVCLTPGERREAWVYRCNGDGIEAQPRAVGNALILADLSGRFEAIDISSGRPTGGVYPPQAGLPAAPAAAPIQFGPDHLFAPMTDGTVLIVPIDQLLPKK